ncbi:MAG: alpha/beta fold hydrolase [Desulfobacterales bacterium]
MLTLDSFRPPLFLKNAHVQTVLASSKLRTLGPNTMRAVARKEIIETAEGVKLLGYHSVQNNRQAKGLVILLHGWEGSVDSTYLMRCARSLYRHGYDIFRLNFRDHGDSHHLNSGIFYAVLLEEVYQAVIQAAAFATGVPVFMIGFSLGGNFVLRILEKCGSVPFTNLRHAVSISPVLNPEEATMQIDRIAFIRKYFLTKWRRSLAKKQELFPDLYDFENVMDLKTIQAVTDALLEKYSDFETARDYFHAYSVMGSAIEGINIPTTIIAAEDDPIIPIKDFHDLKLNKHIQLIIHSYGGHNGFITGFKLQSWYENRIIRLFDQICGKMEEYYGGRQND